VLRKHSKLLFSLLMFTYGTRRIAKPWHSSGGNSTDCHFADERRPRAHVVPTSAHEGAMRRVDIDSWSSQRTPRSATVSGTRRAHACAARAPPAGGSAGAESFIDSGRAWVRSAAYLSYRLIVDAHYEAVVPFMNASAREWLSRLGYTEVRPDYR